MHTHRLKRQVTGRLPTQAAAVLLGFTLTSATSAQTTPQTTITPPANSSSALLSPQIAELEAYLARHPDNVDALYTYAHRLLQAQRMAEAREAYLSILRLRPGHLATTMELAMLDHRMQQLDSARAGYEQLLRANDLPPDVRAVVQQRLAQLNQALNVHRLYGSVTLGLTAQHNANAGPAGDRVDILGAIYPLWDSAARRSDVMRTANASLGWRWHWNQQGDYWQTSGNVLTALPHHVPRNRRQQMSLRTGPTFSMARWGLQGQLGVQLVAHRVDLARAHYLDSQGLEVNSNWRIAPRQLLTLSWHHLRENYAQNSTHPTGNAKDQHRNALTAGWQYQWSTRAMVYARWMHEKRSAHDHAYSLQRNLWTAGASTSYPSPFAWSPGPWRSSIYASYAHKKHQAPNTKISLDQVQRTSNYSVGFAQQIPLTEAVSANLGLSWLRVRSNYDMATYNDRSVNVSLTYAF